MAIVRRNIHAAGHRGKEKAQNNLKNTYIKSPLNYVGGKYKLLPQIIPLFPDDIDTFVDLFGGGFNVGINVNAKNIVYNDAESHVVELLRGLYKSNYDDVHATICQIIDEYGLSRSDVHGYEFYGCESNSGLGQYNKKNIITCELITIKNLHGLNFTL